MDELGSSHELSLIKSFVIKERQQRYVDLISTVKGRLKFRSHIAHFKDLNKDLCSELSSDISNSYQLHDLLKQKGASDICYIIASSSKFDGKSMLLEEAVGQLFLSGIDFFLSCKAGELVYFEGEGIKNRYLLQKTT